MAIISMRIPKLERAIRSIDATARAPARAFNESVVEICRAVGKPLSAATLFHLATDNPPKETKS